MGKARPSEVWRRVCFDVVEPVRVQLERTLELSRLSGAGSRMEALEFIAVLAEQAMMEPHAEWAARCTTPEARFRMAVRDRDGWRCRLCGHSANIEVHHIWTREWCRDTGRLELLVDPANGISLCARDHAAIQQQHDRYRDHFFALIRDDKRGWPNDSETETP